MKRAIKWIALALIACMALSLAACNQPDTPSASTTQPSNSQPSDPKPTDPQPTEPKELTLHDGIYISDAIDMGQGRGNAYN